MSLTPTLDKLEGMCFKFFAHRWPHFKATIVKYKNASEEDRKAYLVTLDQNIIVAFLKSDTENFYMHQIYQAMRIDIFGNSLNMEIWSENNRED